MPREIPIGNGDLLIAFDEHYRIRDFYHPFVGRYNHTNGHVQRFGVWADGQFAWIEDESWVTDEVGSATEAHSTVRPVSGALRYKVDTLVTEVRLVNHRLGLSLVCNDAVDYTEPVYFRRVVVKDLWGRQRDVRLFFHIDLSINESPVGDTANYDPETQAVILYKDESYFLVNACAEFRSGVDHWSIGSKRVGGAEGTWRDAEDGVLGRNAISQGSVDATIGVNLSIPAHAEESMAAWIACGDSYDSVRRRNRLILERRPEDMISATEAYWRLWARKERIDLNPLPERIRDLYNRSQLILRTQVDNRGAIIAANDSDITHFAGDHYSYCWPRDGALVAHALILSGHGELSRNFFRYCGRVIHRNGYFLHKYTPAGHLASSWHPWILSGVPVLPIQQDETALVLWALRQHFETFRDIEFVKPLYNSLVVQPAKWLLQHRDENGLPNPSWDLWEERRGVHTFTVAATIGALMAASRFARDFGQLRRAEAWEDGANSMRQAMLRYIYSEQLGRFARMVTPIDPGPAAMEAASSDGGHSEGVRAPAAVPYRLDMTRDSANFALWAFGALRADNPTVVAEMKGLRERLWVKTPVGGCARYERDYYHQVERDNIDAVPGNPWIICTLWHAQHTIATARTLDELRAAAPLLDWAASRATASGVLAEQHHPYTGAPLSVSPLTWSHATFVTTVAQYVRKYESILSESATAGPGTAATVAGGMA